MAGKFKKLLSSLLAVALVFCGLPITAGAVDVEIQEGMPQIVYATNGVNANTVTVVGFAGHEWYVIGYNGGGIASSSETMTLLAKNRDFGTTTFGSDSKYVSSTLHTAMQNLYNDTLFMGANAKEKDLVLMHDLNGVWDGTGEASFNYSGTLVNQYIWPLSYNEAYSLNNSDNADTVMAFGGNWWLRSPGSSSITAAFVDGNGSVHAGGYSMHGVNIAIRPAFKLNLKSVIFTSAASGGKSANVGDPLESATAPSGVPVKLTVESSGQKLENVALTGGEGTNKLTFFYDNSSATTGTNQYISCVLANSSGAVKYYGKLKDLTGGRGDGSFNVLLANVVDGTYTLKIFSEQENGPNYTDFCSTPVTMTIEVENETGTVVNTTPPTPPTPTPPTPTPSTSTRRRSSGSGQTYTPPAAAIPTNFVVDATKAKSALEEKGKSGAAKARIRHNGEIKVLQEAWKAFGKTPVDFYTADENGVQVRVTIPEPGKMTGDKLLSGYINGSAAENRKAHFEKWYKNKLRVIHLDQTEPWGQPVEIAAKLDLTGMDAGNLYFYSYDSKTNTYRQIKNPAYRIDENGFLHFITEYAGDIIISDGPLERV